MSLTNHYAHGVRIANFSKIDLQVDDLLKFDSEERASIVKKIRQYADLPYVYIVGNEQAKQVADVLSALKAIRSPCYPYAIFSVGDADLSFEGQDLDIIPIDNTNADTLQRRINEYAALRFQFDDSQLSIGNAGSLPVRADVAIVGAGVTGLYAANRLMKRGISFCILEKRDKVGGIWSMYANATSRVNTSEGAYRLIENATRSNRDHSATREILEDVTQLSANVSDHLFLETEVLGIEKSENGYQIRYNREGASSVLESKGVILAINDRVGTPRELEWPDRSTFQGTIVGGISDQTKELDWRNKNVVVVGMGAFAIENARTALEGGARHVTVICRRHGTICPKIIDYLNFATPYDDDFKHDKKSNIRNMMYWKKLYQLSGATQPECWMGKIKHAGHTISVSDIWFIAHYLKKIETISGEITDLYKNGVVVNGQQHIDADIIVNCIGFERNISMAKAICGYAETYNTNYVDKDFMYLADAYIDDDAFNSFFGSSVIEMVKFYMDVYIRYFDNPEYEKMAGLDGIEKIPIEDRKWSDYIKGAAALILNDPELNQTARKQVAQRTKNFLENHNLEIYIAENKREWIDTHSMLAGKLMKEEDCLPFVFEKLLPKPI